MANQAQLTITNTETGAVIASVYLLNPGEFFQGFGGSRHSLPVKKTASIIVRSHQGLCISDVEHDIAAPAVWEWIARLVSDKTLKVSASA